MSGWPEKQLSEISSVVTKGTTPTTLGYKFVSDGVPFLRAEDVNGGAIDWTGVTHHVTSECHARLERSQLLPGDLLVTIAGSVGRIGFVPENAPPLNCNQAVCLVRLNRGQILVEYASYILQSSRVLANFGRDGTTATITNLSLKQIREVVVPLPPLDEQRRIVDILKRADSIRRLRKQALEMTRELIPALFVDIFGDPATNPKGWEMVTVGETLTNVDYGTSQKADGDPVGLPVLRMGNVTYQGDLDLESLKYTELTAADRDKYLLQTGDLLFNRTNSKELVGKVGMWDGRFDAVAASYFIRLRADRTKCHSAYLWAFFNTRFMKQRMFETARGAIGQSNINAKELKAFPVALPPLALQEKFAHHIESTQALVRQQEDHERASFATMQSLMAQFFS